MVRGGTGSGAVERMVALREGAGWQGAMRRGGCVRRTVGGIHRGLSWGCHSVCGTKGGDVAGRGQSRRVRVAPLGSRGTREEAQARGHWGRGHSIQADRPLEQARGIRAKAPRDFSVRITSL